MFARSLRRLEAALYGLIGALLVAVLLVRLLAYMELAERTAMASTVNNANAGMTLWLAYETLAGRPVERSALGKRAPFELARMRPDNYLGSQAAPQYGALPRAVWVHDSVRGELVYLPRLRTRLRTADDSGVLRFRIETARSAVSLTPVTAYEWE